MPPPTDAEAGGALVLERLAAVTKERDAAEGRAESRLEALEKLQNDRSREASSLLAQLSDARTDRYALQAQLQRFADEAMAGLAGVVSTPEEGYLKAQHCFSRDIGEFRKLTEGAQARAEKAERFKAYVHERLDAFGVPADPPSPHREQGCRIGGRLDWLFETVEGAKALLAEVLAAGEVALENPDRAKLCGFCGLVSTDEQLREHVLVCKKHPAARFKAQIEAITKAANDLGHCAECERFGECDEQGPCPHHVPAICPECQCSRGEMLEAIDAIVKDADGKTGPIGSAG